jgi:large subunit ribosomal protein L17
MRHGDKIKNLSRTASHRAALLSNLTAQLIQYKRITTTLAKAKALRVYAEPIITRSKNDTMHNRRIVFSYLQDKESIKELFGVISDKVADRPGGYTRIIKLPRRIGDAADMAMIELVDFNTIYGKDTEAAAAKKTRRSRRSSGAKATTETSTPAPVAAAEETIVEANETTEVTETTEATEVTEVTETTTEVTETTTEVTETTTEENNA